MAKNLAKDAGAIADPESTMRSLELHPLVHQQLEEATGPGGTVDLAALLRAVSTCYEVSTSAALDVIRQGTALLSDPETASSESTTSERKSASSKTPLPPAFMDKLSDGLIIVDGAGHVETLNAQAITALDLGAQGSTRVLNQPLRVCLEAGFGEHTAEPNTLLSQLSTAPTTITGNRTATVDLKGRGQLTLDAVPRDEGGMYLLIRSGSADQQDERALQIAQNEYGGLFENAVVGIYRVTLEGQQVRANPALVALNGYDSEEELLANVRDIAKEWYVEPARRNTFMRELHDKGHVTDFISQVYRHKTRDPIWVSEHAWLVYDPCGKPLFYEGTVVEATERVAAEEEINHLAHYDHLTGLANRFQLLKGLRHALLQPQMAASVAVHCLDLDHFKDVNDTLGHQAGDQLLISAAKRLRRSIKSTDLLARFGGDEFTILQYGVRKPEDVEALAERVVDMMKEPFFIGDTRVNVGVSVGVARHSGQEPAAMLRDADVALYEAKRQGRQNYVIYTPEMGDILKERRALEDDLRTAIDTGNFELHLQPIIDAETGEAMVYEALLRWSHPTRGSVSPQRFVPLAEESSQMIALGGWVINKAMEAAAHLPDGKRIAINLSPVQLRESDFVERVQHAMQRFGVAPNAIELEITETAIMSDDQTTRKTLAALRDMGLHLALDDFGTGHASLSYLQQFRFDKIKIDQSFVARMVDDPISCAVVRAVTSLGADLGASVVAEGVETEEQREALTREGCKLFQGYLFGKPEAWDKVLIPESATS